MKVVEVGSQGQDFSTEVKRLASTRCDHAASGCEIFRANYELAQGRALVQNNITGVEDVSMAILTRRFRGMSLHETVVYSAGELDYDSIVSGRKLSEDELKTIEQGEKIFGSGEVTRALIYTYRHRMHRIREILDELKSLQPQDKS